MEGDTGMTQKDVFIDLDTGKTEAEVKAETPGVFDRRYVMLPSEDEDGWGVVIADNSEGLGLTEAQMNRLVRLWEER